MSKVKVTIDQETYEYEKGICYESIAEEFQSRYEDKIADVIVNGRIRELSKRLEKDCVLSFCTEGDSIGHKTYERTATMLLLKALHDVLGEKLDRAVIEFSIGAGLYCSIHGDVTVDDELVSKVNKRMQELVDAKTPIIKKSYPIEDAMAIFSAQHMEDKINLFRFRRSSAVNVYCMDGYYDYFYGFMMPNAGYIKLFKVTAYKQGLMLVLPTQENTKELGEYDSREKLFQTLMEATNWNQYFGISTVGDLNNQICQGKLNDLILIQEAEQERRIGEIAKQIAARKGVKFVMIAGPSSSGKTTFSHRLSMQLRTQGLVPHPIALDDYFVERVNTPRDKDGNYDFECLEAMDIQLFNNNMCDLLSGKTVDMPVFNFKTGLREYNGNMLTLGKEDVLVIEGIHGLDSRMTYALPEESKFRIYISALTSLNVDGHNRIPTADARMLRRMVRDYRTRGASAQKTISMWSSVRKGEELNIFPFQESADVMFNSALIYELSILKQYAEPLLFGIQKGEPEYLEAKRLLKFLGYFLGISSENVPNNSICREFIGGSCFHV
ncbi:MAG: nucleoside kinase [Lachnospiraceae bacterium]|nr:nucleoside kinase [Lachnospiraceae bacterium]